MNQTILGSHSSHQGTLRRATLAGFLTLLLAPSVCASDHADPIFNKKLEGGITDLFAFPAAKDGVRMTPNKDAAGNVILTPEGKGTYQFPAAAGVTPPKPGEKVEWDGSNEIVLILCVRRALTTSSPYGELDKYTYTIHLDFHSELDFEKNKANLARYGGTVVHPEGIEADVKINFQLDANAQFVQSDKNPVRFEGSGWKKARQVPEPFVGVRDDPFIFPQFFGTNVIAFVVRIPIECLPEKKDFILWATSERGGKIIDHVGRSQRTQLPRFDSLNTLPPKEHVSHLREMDKNPGLVEDVFRNVLGIQFALRPYDFEPDVMFYNRKAGVPICYPNGRQLEDDVARLTCLQGDCQLFELSQSHPKFSMGPAGRPTKNDKDFTDTFPYLAEPWPDSTPPMGRGPTSIMLTTKNHAILISSIIAAVVVFLLPWVLYFWTLRRLRRATQRVASTSPTRSPAPTGQSLPSIPAAPLAPPTPPVAPPALPTVPPPT